MITISAFRWVPDFAQGLVRDLRVRWALEEAGIAYRVRLIGPEDQPSPAYRAVQPFGQVPMLEDDGLVLFESGAIVLHIGERSPVLLPEEARARARAITWMFAALNSVEPYVQGLCEIDLFHAGEAWAKERRPAAEALLVRRLADLSARLGDQPYLDGASFTAGDLMMTTVLRNLRHTDLLQSHANLVAHKGRCEARPAFARALQAQMATFRANAA
jgi:glutathione S-transferase